MSLHPHEPPDATGIDVEAALRYVRTTGQIHRRRRQRLTQWVAPAAVAIITVGIVVAVAAIRKDHARSAQPVAGAAAVVGTWSHRSAARINLYEGTGLVDLTGVWSLRLRTDGTGTLTTPG